jgi:ABC-2 type transport system permease protein
MTAAPARTGRAGRAEQARWALHAEWTKLRTLPGTRWLVLGILLGTVGAGAAQAASIDTAACPTPTTCFEDTTAVALGGVVLGQAAVVILAVTAVTTEHATGTIAATLAAVPRRGTVLAAKAAIVSLLVVPAAALATGLSLVAGRLILPANGFDAANGYAPLTPADPATLRAAVGTVLYLGLVALLGVGVGALVRDTAGAIGLVLSLLYLFPIVASLAADPVWHDRIESIGPMSAGLTVQATVALDRHPIGPWAGLAVLAAYAATALATGALTFHRRDA